MNVCAQYLPAADPGNQAADTIDRYQEFTRPTLIEVED
jgi:hypothetical protein